MESIKHKMECLVKEKDESITRATDAEAIGAQVSKIFLKSFDENQP
jgi:hypothetical protein